MKLHNRLVRWVLVIASVAMVLFGGTTWALSNDRAFADGLRPLSIAEARSTRAAQACAQTNVHNVIVCDGALYAGCSHTWYGACCGTCRDGCTPVLDQAAGGAPSWGYFTTTTCGALGATYNVHTCASWPINCCTAGPITGTFACNSANTTTWVVCGVTTG